MTKLEFRHEDRRVWQPFHAWVTLFIIAVALLFSTAQSHAHAPTLIKLTAADFRAVEEWMKVTAEPSKEDEGVVNFRVALDPGKFPPELSVDRIHFRVTRNERDVFSAMAKSILQCGFSIPRADLESTECSVWLDSDAFTIFRVYHWGAKEMVTTPLTPKKSNSKSKLKGSRK